MKHTLITVLFCAAAISTGWFTTGAIAQSLSGKVTDEQQQPLSNINVQIPALHMQVGTAADGAYAFSKIPPGNYTVEFYSIGYLEETRTVECANDNIALDVVLHASPLELPVVTVTAKPQPTEINNSSQPVDVLEGRELDIQRGQSVIQSIQYFPGVSTFSRGPLSMKPVIRGLTSQRVVVLEDGMKHESQQWDDEQSPEIDALDVARIEVLRGPNSVLYGSDALGGVVNVISQDPRALGSEHLSGNLLLNSFSNNQQGSAGLTLFGTSEAVDYKTQFSVRHAEDITTPEGRLDNSGASEVNGSGMIGLRQEWGTLSLKYSHFDQEIHISPDPDADPDAAPEQQITHDKVMLSYSVPISLSRLEINSTWQRSERSEFEDEDQVKFDSAQVKLRLATISVDARFHHEPIGNLRGTIGASLMSQKNETLGLEPLIPGFDQLNVAGYVYEELPISPVSLSAGLRFDSRRLEVDENDDLGVLDQTRNYAALTGTLGMVWHVMEPWTFALNLGRGWRAPIAEELFINGVDEGSIRYKVGNANLEPEESFNVDLSTRYTSSQFNISASGFHNRINRYIFLSPTAAIDSTSGFTKYNQKQANATLLGGEVSMEAAVTEHVVLRGGYDLVLGRNEETDTWLPMIPAHRFKGGIRFTERSLGEIHNPYVAFNVNAVLNQEKIDAFESNTGGYTLFDIGIGAEVSMGSKRLMVDCSIENLFDRAYFDHLSRYKDYGLNPGRNVTVKFSVPFTLVQ